MCHYRNAITTTNLTTISMMLTNHKPGELTSPHHHKMGRFTAPTMMSQTTKPHLSLLIFKLQSPHQHQLLHLINQFTAPTTTSPTTKPHLSFQISKLQSPPKLQAPHLLLHLTNQLKFSNPPMTSTKKSLISQKPSKSIMPPLLH
jgi:hypothetical protein